LVFIASTFQSCRDNSVEDILSNNSRETVMINLVMTIYDIHKHYNLPADNIGKSHIRVLFPLNDDENSLG